MKNLNEILLLHKKWLDGETDGKKANLRYADLSNADLSNADLRSADLSNADLRSADLRSADLSNAVGILSSIDYLENNFEKTSEGYIAYKVFNGSYRPSKEWVIEKNGIISENINPNRTNICGCGINVAPLEWVKDNYNKEIWKVLIRWEWLAGVCVPYNTDGKIRCERVQLLEVVG